MTPVPKLRRDTKHDARQRQLPLRALVLVLALAAVPGRGEAPQGSAVQEELRAAKVLETALMARQAGADEWQKLEKIYRDLEARHPRNVAVKSGRAELLWIRGEKTRALEMWQAALEIEPGNVEVLTHLGEGHLAAGEVKKAAAVFTRAVESAPRHAGCRFSLANITFLFRHELYDAARPDEAAMLTHALALFAEASQLEPRNTEYARAYAETFYSLPRPDWNVALAAWRHFAEISPQQDFAQANLARVHLKLGQKEAARACLEKVQDPEYQRLKSRLAERIETE